MSYDLPYEFHPADNIVCSGLPPADAFQRLADDGVSVAINLRESSEDPGRSLKSEVEGAGIRYIHIPISGAEGFNRENAQLLDNAIKETSSEGKKLYVFCGSSNRVGGLFALQSFLFGGKSKEEATLYGESAGLKSLKNMILSVLDQFDE